MFKFPYINGAPRLTIQARKRSGDKRFVRALVDSGADCSIISEVEALELGIEYNKMSACEQKLVMVNSSRLKAKKTTLLIKLVGKELLLPFFIAKGCFECVLGRKGFFEYFDILFQERKQQISLAPMC